MKTRIATLMLMLGIFLSTTAFASEPAPATKAASNSVVKYIQKNLDYPDFAIDDKFECCVVVSLTIQEDGTLDVNSSNSVDKDMQNYVVREIEDFQNDDFIQYAGQRVYLKINFDLLTR